MSSNERVAIIGCGPSGISLLSAFNRLEKKGQQIPKIVCFEKQDTIGGLWNYTWHTGTDKYGEQCHNSMYRYLWTNGAKEVLEMADYTFAEHFGKPIPSFPPRSVLADYVIGKAKKNDVSRFVRVNTIVRHVEQKDNKIVITSQDLKSKKRTEETFDYLIVATGHFSVPHLPTYTGIDSFEGEILHCHDFRDAAKYKGKKVLVLGNGYSGEDVALVCHKYGVEDITISYKTKPTGFKWPNGVKEIQQLLKFENDSFHFKDGSTDKFDVLIFCTGYQHNFPFLPDDLRLETENNFFIDGLYKGIVLNKDPRVMYVGMQNQYYSFSMFDVQACFVRDYILGKIDMKNESERSEDIKLWNDKSSALKEDEHEVIDFQRDYISDLSKCCDCPEDHNDKRAEIMHEWKNNRAENILTYRDKSFTSLMTGDVAPIPNIPWLENKDDSIEGYVNAA